MKALTIHQPYASFIALGAKFIETRTRPTRHRGPIAIHAAAYGPSVTRWGRDGTRTRLGDFDIVRMPTTVRVYRESMAWPYAVPLGAVVATATVVDCIPIVTALPPQDQWDAPWSLLVRGDRTLQHYWWPGHGSADGCSVGDQLPYGDFTPGRWAWMLTDTRPVIPPVPAKGKQGLWIWTRP